ncbi:response regulator transcription factor [Halomonas alkalisoli]|uniref:response regulator transcription factor n=1 Tax=Halomonas alkalisoli TaxID=2907158 RepID=UPI001F1E9A12|nr:response regulator transcription factor [Halomonas alkalisoli]MCE9682190.1 response regulator transcription factor [Halomonas alkalisoli]
MLLKSPPIYLVTEPTPQSQRFADNLHRQLECAVTLLMPGMTGRPRGENRLLILLDIDHLDEAAQQAWQRRANELPEVFLAAVNLCDEVQAVELFSCLHLQGIFYRGDSLELICKGLTLLREGRFWMSRSLMASLLEYYRQSQRNRYCVTCGLTQRELEIIGLLGAGATNMEIAERLFVSEYTVRSHLYNIFRKIDVHTRAQAINWTRRHLGVLPPLQERRYPV